MRAFLLLCLWFAAGCDRGPCAGIAGTCLSLEVQGDPQIKVDQVQVQVDGQVLHSYSDPAPLPISLAVSFPQNAQGPYVLLVQAYLGQQLVGSGQGEAELTAGREASLEVALASP